MKKADIISCIEDGDELAWSSYVPREGLPSSPRRVRAISVNAEREKRVGGSAWERRTVKTTDGVEVEFLDDDGRLWGYGSAKKGERMVVKTRELVMTWAEFTAEKRRLDEVQQAKEAARDEALERAEAARNRLGFGRVQSVGGRFQIVVSVEEAEAR